jgi:subtilisin family serine protease
LRHLQDRSTDIELLELDPLLEATALDDIPENIELASFQRKYPDLDGEGMTVALLDTGVDLEHPHLDVAESFTECGEPLEIPGQHGTHCAGIIASRDEEFRGVAPGVRLVNIKVARASGRLEPGELVRGFDRAAAVGAHIVSVSLGFNHRPRYTVRGHGWACSRRRPCLVCRAVDTAVRREAHLVVIAAGNEHEYAETMRRAGDGSRLDTELCCPGQARLAVTVASINKRSWLPADSSSRGPSSSGARKPNIAAPGVNVTSTVPVPREANGQPVADVLRSDIFARSSGTSMATPVVAGIAALLGQRMERRGRKASPSALRRTLMRAAHPLPYGNATVGHGRAATL